MYIKYQHHYKTRYQLNLKTKGPGTKVLVVDYLEEEEANKIPAYRYYSLPNKFRKPHRLSWRVPKGYISFGRGQIIPEPPVIEIKFPKAKSFWGELEYHPKPWPLEGHIDHYSVLGNRIDI